MRKGEARADGEPLYGGAAQDAAAAPQGSGDPAVEPDGLTSGAPAGEPGSPTAPASGGLAGEAAEALGDAASKALAEALGVAADWDNPLRDPRDRRLPRIA